MRYLLRKNDADAAFILASFLSETVCAFSFLQDRVLALRNSRLTTNKTAKIAFTNWEHTDMLRSFQKTYAECVQDGDQKLTAHSRRVIS